jgi:hypothetical protein
MLAFLLLAILQDPAAVARSVDAAVPVKDHVPCDDETYLRRVTADRVGRAPAPQEIQAFKADPAADKRARKVDELLASADYGAFWGRRIATMLIGDPAAFELKGFEGLDPKAGPELAERFVGWLAKRLNEDRPWTETVAALLEARGSTAEVPELAYKLSFHGRGLPASQATGAGVSRHLLGVLIDCARCHDHPYERWNVPHFYGIAAFFVRERVAIAGKALTLKVADGGEQEIATPLSGRAGAGTVEIAKPAYLFGGAAPEGAGVDREKVLASLMTAKTNLQLFKALTNRVWAWVFGRGVVDPVDDFTPMDLPKVAGLLDSLARLSADGRRSIQGLLRGICATRLYSHAGQDAGDRSWRGTMSFAPRRWWRPLPKSQEKPLPLVVVIPDGWERIGRHSIVRLPAGAAAWRLPGKSADLDADLHLFAGQPGKKLQGLAKQWMNQVLEPVEKSEEIAGAGKVSLLEVSGTYWCDARVDGGRPFRLLVAQVDSGASAHLFRLMGPAETVEAAREAFVGMLKSAKK